MSPRAALIVALTIGTAVMCYTVFRVLAWTTDPGKVPAGVPSPIADYLARLPGNGR